MQDYSEDAGGAEMTNHKPEDFQRVIDNYGKQPWSLSGNWPVILEALTRCANRDAQPLSQAKGDCNVICGTHEAYLGYCVHCGVPIKNGKAAPQAADEVV